MEQQKFLALVGKSSEDYTPIEIFGWRRVGSASTFAFGPEHLYANNKTTVPEICQAFSIRFGKPVIYAGFRKANPGSAELPSFEIQQDL